MNLLILNKKTKTTALTMFRDNSPIDRYLIPNSEIVIGVIFISAMVFLGIIYPIILIVW